jgi:hypothetical protein
VNVASGFGTIDFSFWRLLLVTVVIGCAGVLGYLVSADMSPSAHGRSVRGSGTEPPTTPMRGRRAGPPPPAAPGPGEDAGRLLRALIGAYDTSTEQSVRLHITQELHKAGVEIVIIEPGVPFSADHMRCVATEGTSEPQVDQLVARTERPGWIRADGAVVRVPEVTIWKVPR